MGFDEWFDKYNYQREYTVEEYVTTKAAWEAGIQEGIDRMYRLYDICPECRLPDGQHKIDCSQVR